MDLTEKHLSALLSISKALNALFIGLVVISLYLIPRGFAVEINLRNAEISELFKIQATIHNLGFSYLAMSILWPTCIAALCLVFTLLAKKHSIVLDRILTDNPDTIANDISLADPFYLFNMFSERWLNRFLWWLLRYLPTLAVTLHAFMTCIGLFLTLVDGSAPDWLLYKAPFQLILSIVAIPFSIAFSRSVLSLRNRFEVANLPNE